VNGITPIGAGRLGLVCPIKASVMDVAAIACLRVRICRCEQSKKEEACRGQNEQATCLQELSV
jgi:hypothetical protein